jgi:hypothetical protein
MSEHDDDIVVQGNVGETMRAEKEKEQANKKEQEEEKGESQQAELQQKIEAREEEKGKGEVEEEKLTATNITGSELSPRQQGVKQKRKKAKSAKQKEEEQQPTLVNLSNELKKYTRHLSNIEGIVQPLPKYLKNADKQSKMIKELYTSVKQLQRYMGQIQKNMQRKK